MEYTEKEIRYAEELFNCFQLKVNSIRDTYCNKFENLEQRQRLGWCEVSRNIIGEKE